MTSLRILVHRTDESLDDEIRAAVVSLSDSQTVLHFQGDLRGTVTAAENFQPSLVLLEIADDLEATRTLVEESLAVVPDATIVGVYDVDRLPPSETESTMMMRALRLGVEDFVRRPVIGNDLEQLIQRRLGPRKKKKLANAKLVSFISNKGGVGKSTSAVNVAVALAKDHPGRVALIDGSLQMGVCAAQLNMMPRVTLVDAWEQRERLDEELLRQLMTTHESGLELLAAPESAIDAAEIDEAFFSRILLMARRLYDYVIIDTFPLFDRTVMTILDLSDQAVIVVENVVPTLQTVRGFFDLLSEVNFPESRQRVLLNRFTTRGGSPGIGDVAKYLERQPDYVVPFNRNLGTAANTGTPVVMTSRRGAASAFRELAKDIQSLEVREAPSFDTANEANRPSSEQGAYESQNSLGSASS